MIRCSLIHPSWVKQRHNYRQRREIDKTIADDKLVWGPHKRDIAALFEIRTITPPGT